LAFGSLDCFLRRPCGSQLHLGKIECAAASRDPLDVSSFQSLEHVIKVKANLKPIFVATVTSISNEFLIGVVCKTR